MKGQYRYPGTQAFQAEDATIFHGRDEDIRHLLRLIRLEQMVVLHGKSGLGKSSLINAGILPQLQQLDLDPAEKLSVKEVRFGAFQQEESLAPVEVLKDQISTVDFHPWLRHFMPGEDSLWLRCKNHQLQENNEAPLLLVFDQFEELFTYPGREIGAFKTALAELLHTEVPTALRKAVRAEQLKGSSELSADDRRLLLRPVSTKILLIIRSDRLSLLDQFTSHLPNMLVNLYELHPLNQRQARAAIVEPAASDDKEFTTTPFTFESSALQSILNGLSNDDQEIESFQLQLLCQYLENKVAQNPELTTIREADFGGEKGIQDILHNYYERQLAQLAPEDQLIARRFIEEGLIVNENRVPVAAGAEESRFGVSQQLLDQLLASRLIRVENIHLGKIYELSHDTLVEPVRRSLLRRHEEEERERIAQELELEREERKKAQQARRRNRIIALLGFTLFALATVAGIFALLKYQDAESARKTAEANERRATAAALAARAWEIYSYDHTLASRVVEAALQIDSQNQEVIQILGRIVNSPQTSFYQKVLGAHNFEVNDAAFSPTGKYVATASHDQKVVLWDSFGNVVHQFLGKLSGANHPGHDGPVRAVGFSTDERELYSAGVDGMIKIWDTPSGTLVREWKAHQEPITCLAHISGSPYLITGSKDRSAIIWDNQGNQIATMIGHQAEITDIAVSQNGQQILTTSMDGTARLWNNRGQLLRIFQDEGIAITAGAFSPDGKVLAFANSNNTATIWDINGQKIRSFAGHKGQVTDIEYFPDGEYLLTASEDATAKVWTPLGEEVLTLTGHRKRLNFAKISPDGASIATGGFDFTAKLWDVGFNLDIQRHRHQDFIYCVDISDDDQLIVTASKDFTAKIWNMQGQWKADMAGHTNVVQTAFFIKDKQEIITASRDGTARIWDYQGQPLLTIPHEVNLTFARATANRKWIIATASDGTIFLHDQSGKLIKKWSSNPDGRAINGLAIHPQEHQFATVQSNLVALWDWDGSLIDSFSVETAPVVFKVAYSNDGQALYTTAREYPVRKWSLDGQLLASFLGHTEENYWIAVHPQQEQIATASWDQTLKIWGNDGKISRSIPHQNGVYSVDYSSDGNILVTGSHNNIGHIWSNSGELLAALGERINPQQVLTSTNIAPFAELSFSVTEEKIPKQYFNILAKSNPNQYLKEAEVCLEQAGKNEYTIQEKLAFFDQAIEYYQEAQKLFQGDSTNQIPQHIAEVYRQKGEQLLIHQRFAEALTAFEEGLTHAELDYLLVLKTLALLYTNQYDQAAALAETYKDRPTPQIDWYENYGEAVQGDLEYFEMQFGISHPDGGRLVELLQADLQ